MAASQRILFAGTPDFALPPLQALLDSTHDVIAVLTQPDRPAGRGRQLQVSPVKALALQHQLPVLQPVSLQDAMVQKQLAALQPDLMVVVAYGLLLPQALLDMPAFGCVNIHASLLPRWRGAAPIQRAILAGDKRTGVALMQMDAGLDTGAVWCTLETAIEPHETAARLHDRLADLGAEVLLQGLPLLFSAAAKPVAQSNEGLCYANKISKAEAIIDWQQPAALIARQVRAFNPWPVASTLWHAQQLRIWQARVVSQNTAPHAEPGRVIATPKGGIVVQCGADALMIEALQLPGKRRLLAADFLNAHAIAGQRLG
jgi:methionyl-tRNA formyltransferase